MSLTVTEPTPSGRKIRPSDPRVVTGTALAIPVADEDGNLLALPYLEPEQFGAVGDNVTDDGPAFLAMLAYAKANASVHNSIYRSGQKIRLRNKKYYLGTSTLDLTFIANIDGHGGGFDGVGAGSTLRWAANTTGIRLQAHNTSGAGTYDAVMHDSAAGTRLVGFEMIGGFAGTEGEYHGIHAKVRFTASDLTVRDFAGDGLHINASAGAADATEGNCNGFRLRDSSFLSCRNGIYTRGADANAGAVSNVNVNYNRAWGVNEGSFLGNGYEGMHAAGNGTSYAGAPYVVVHNNGHWFSVKDGQLAGAATNSPPTTATDNTWWYYVLSLPASVYVPQWTNGISLRYGGAYYSPGVSNESVFISCYSESDQGTSQMNSPTIVLGGLHGAADLQEDPPRA